MKKQTIQYFFIGVLISFTISVLILSAVFAATASPAMIPVTMICQVFIMSVLCSLINLVYQSEKLKFLWKSIIAYILTTSVILMCGSVFGWYNFGGNSLFKTRGILIFFVICTIFYLITWLIIWKISEARKKELNNKLNEYKKTGSV